MVVRVAGSALPGALVYSKSQRLTDLAVNFGNDLVAAYCAFPSVSRTPGVENMGDAIGAFHPLQGRRSASGTFPTGYGRGAVINDTTGFVLADTTPGTLDIEVDPLTTASFGVGVLFYLEQSFFDSISHPIFGNEESGGATVMHACSRTGAGQYEGSITWDGITNSFYGSNADSFERGRIMEPGWHHVTVDRHAGVAGLRVDGQAVITNTALADDPTLSSINLGSLTSGDPSYGIHYSLVVVCDGPLAQSNERQADWEAVVERVQNAVKV